MQIPGPVGALEALVEEPEPAGTDAFAVICHPHPLHGGTMQNKVVHTIARACQAVGMPTVRVNFRGVGASAGSYDQGQGEMQDALAVIEWGRRRWPGAALTLAGFSFGAMVSILIAGEAKAGRLLSVAPAVGRPEFAQASLPPCPWLILQGDADELVKVDDVRAFAARFEPPPTLQILPGAEHFFHGRLVELRDHISRYLQ
jgi:alpha/beta superfamily hydrolase